MHLDAGVGHENHIFTHTWARSREAIRSFYGASEPTVFAKWPSAHGKWHATDFRETLCAHEAPAHTRAAAVIVSRSSAAAASSAPLLRHHQPGGRSRSLYAKMPPSKGMSGNLPGT